MVLRGGGKENEEIRGFRGPGPEHSKSRWGMLCRERRRGPGSEVGERGPVPAVLQRVARFDLGGEAPVGSFLVGRSSRDLLAPASSGDRLSVGGARRGEEEGKQPRDPGGGDELQPEDQEKNGKTGSLAFEEVPHQRQFNSILGRVKENILPCEKEMVGARGIEPPPTGPMGLLWELVF